jgi:hypothetical protein
VNKRLNYVHMYCLALANGQLSAAKWFRDIVNELNYKWEVASLDHTLGGFLLTCMRKICKRGAIIGKSCGINGERSVYCIKS